MNRVSRNLSLLTTGLLLPFVAGCGTSHPIASHSGAVTVAYAGSLQLVNQQNLGPEFSKMTGIHYSGRGGGAFGLAHEIASHTIQADVFESMGLAPIKVIAPGSQAWGIAVASSPLVVAYSPKSSFASTLNAIRTHKAPLSELFSLMLNPRFKLGRTNPVTDPQGQAFAEMVQLAVNKYHLSPHDVGRILGGSATKSREIYSEEGILTNLQSGGLDASSAFLSEAIQRHLPYITLPPSLNFGSLRYAPTYARAGLEINGARVTGVPLLIDVTLTQRHPSTAALHFLNFLADPKGQNIWKQMGYHTFAPYVVGNSHAVPKGVTIP